MIDLGVPGLEALPFVAADPVGWNEFARRLNSKVFLRSEGTVVTVGAPQSASGQLVAGCAEIARRFDRFYTHAVAAYFARPELQDEFLVNPLLDPLFALEQELTAGASATPLSRLDCVLGSDGSLRVIEINSVGVNLVHVRSLLYLMRWVERAGHPDGARTLETLGRAVVDGFDRAYRARQPDPKRRPVVGGVTPTGWFRVTQMLFREMFRSAGWDYVYGSPDQLDITDRGVSVAGQQVDILWPDFLFYIAYQEARYSQTKFPSALGGGYDSTPALVAAIVSNRRLLEHLAARRVIIVSPPSAYLALPKSLLSWIHDEERPVPPGDRQWLQDHVARTYSARDRQRGVITLERTLAEKDRLLVKPCQYGGSHGVELGVMTTPDQWAKVVKTMWDDVTWVVQDYWPPMHITGGDHLSVGVSNYGGELGGIYLRTSASPLVSARSSSFIPVTVAS